MTKTIPATMLKVLMTLAMTSFCDGVTLIDLTHPLKEGEAFGWPGFPDYNFTTLFRQQDTQYNIWLENNKFEMAEHVGTHMDAPAHMSKGKWRMSDIPTDRFSGPGVMVDVREKVKVNDIYQITVDDLKEWESQHGRIPEKAVVLVNFGWSSRYPDKRRVFNTDSVLDPTTFTFPSVSGEAAKWLVEERNVLALGTDTPSPDRGHDFRLPVHMAFLGNDRLVIENVANLDHMPPKGTTVILGALNLYDGSGAPMRLFAFSGGWRCQTTAVGLAGVLSLGLVMVRLLLH